MCCTRSVYSWDVVITKIAGKLFLDKRDDSEFGQFLFFLPFLILSVNIHKEGSLLDLLTVNETAADPPQEEGSSINSPRNLALEALFINHNFSQQVLRMVRHLFHAVFTQKEAIFIFYEYGRMVVDSDNWRCSQCMHRFISDYFQSLFLFLNRFLNIFPERGLLQVPRREPVRDRRGRGRGGVRRLPLPCLGPWQRPQARCPVRARRCFVWPERRDPVHEHQSSQRVGPTRESLDHSILVNRGQANVFMKSITDLRLQT